MPLSLLACTYDRSPSGPRSLTIARSCAARLPMTAPTRRNLIVLARPPALPAEAKTRIVLSILAGEHRAPLLLIGVTVVP